MVSDVMCFLGLFGIILMLISNELIFHSNINRDHQRRICWFIQLSITVSTIGLVGLVIFYHCSNIRLYAIENSLTNCRVRFTLQGSLLIIVEIVICAIHPIPQSLSVHWLTNEIDRSKNFTVLTSTNPSYIATNVALSLPSKLNRISFFLLNVCFHR